MTDSIKKITDELRALREIREAVGDAEGKLTHKELVKVICKLKEGQQEANAMLTDIQQPMFAKYNDIQKMYGISRSFLDILVGNNTVRSVKLSPSRSAQRLYRVADVESYLLTQEDL